MRIYLDNCCFNRPYDDQSQLGIRLESDAKLYIQDRIRKGDIELSWSYVLEYENSLNPYDERRLEIALWRPLAQKDVTESQELLDLMRRYVKLGFKPLDALHIASAVISKCKYFITVDKGILKKKELICDILIISPIDYIQIMEETL